MIKSMTGFGSGEAIGVGRQFRVEIRSVNHRYAEVRIRLPREYGALEESIRKIVLDKVNRGRVELSLTVRSLADDQGRLQVRADAQLARQVIGALREIQEQTQLAGEITLQDLLHWPEVIALEEPEADLEEILSVITQALNLSLDKLTAMREVEGEQLYHDLVGRIGSIEGMIREIEARSPRVVQEYQTRLSERIRELVETVDEARLAQEVAIYAERSSITEELVRLASHCQQFLRSLAGKEPVGRKLDFLLQEMNREVNTIGSKAGDLEIGRLVVEAKSELEKIREQVQNVE